MATNKATSAARKSSLVWIVLSALILAGGVALGALLLLPLIQGSIREPIVMTEAEIEAETQKIYNVQVTGDELIDTGYYYEETYAFIPLSQEYFGALWTGNQYLLVRTGVVPDESVVQYTGTLRELSSDESQEIVADIEREVPNARGLFSSMILDTTDTPTSFENLAIAVFTLLGIGGGLYGLVRGVSHLTNPAKHPFLKSLSRYGDPESVVNSIEKERVLGEEKVGKLTMTRSWLIDEKGNNFRVARAADVIWVYKHGQRNRYGTTYTLRICDRHGEMISVGAKNEAQADEMGIAVGHKVPWAILGYTQDAEEAWKKDRAQLVAAVDKRKAQAAA